MYYYSYIFIKIIDYNIENISDVNGSHQLNLSNRGITFLALVNKTSIKFVLPGFNYKL